jgi:hypothetical protein
MTHLTPNGWEVDHIIPDDLETSLGDGLYSVATGPFVVNIRRTHEGLIIDVYGESTSTHGTCASIALENDDALY